MKHTLKNFVPKKFHNLVLFRVMAFFLLFVCTVNMHAESAQSHSALITINKSDVDLLNIMADIENQSNYLFVCAFQDTSHHVLLDRHKV